ncbi:unnamed protein product [Paramecium pentaurelia]|uniref:Uncharacterized protein n=1 Tax=Paramecium pentaurelia TaxID=43138 RepID=A0A8S1VN44_9CILI|nr:unnamed protein product [Paramecium pentaurelia]
MLMTETQQLLFALQNKISNSIRKIIDSNSQFQSRENPLYQLENLDSFEFVKLVFSLLLISKEHQKYELYPDKLKVKIKQYRKSKQKKNCKPKLNSHQQQIYSLKLLKGEKVQYFKSLLI